MSCLLEPVYFFLSKLNHKKLSVEISIYNVKLNYIATDIQNSKLLKSKKIDGGISKIMYDCAAKCLIFFLIYLIKACKSTNGKFYTYT